MIYNTVYKTEFATWIGNSDSYQNNFMYEGANALQEYFEEYSEDTGMNIEFDPIAWCVEFSEYESFEDFKKESGYFDIEDLDDLRDSTTVIEFDGGIIVQDF